MSQEREKHEASWEREENWERRVRVNYEIPLTYLTGFAVSVCSALVYAGWNANAVYRKIDDAVETAKVVLTKNEEVSIKVLENTTAIKLLDARQFQAENRIDRLEKRK